MVSRGGTTAARRRRAGLPKRPSGGGSRKLTPEGLRELDRINKLLGVKPSDLADPRSRSASRQARDFVAKEKAAAAKAAAAKAAAAKAAAAKAAAAKAAAAKATAARSAKERAEKIARDRAERARKEAREKRKGRGVTTGEVQPASQPTGFIKRNLKKLIDLAKARSTKSIRTQQSNLRNELELLGLTVGVTVIGGVASIVALPKTLVNIARNPSSLKAVPGKIRSGAAEFGQLIRISPTEALGKIGGEIVLLKGTGETLKVVGTVSGKVATRLNPKFSGISKNKITIPSIQKGKTIDIKVGGPVSKIAEPLRKQAGRAGKRVTAVSAQADRLVNLIKTKRVVRKPIPGEENLKPSVKRLLRKFDRRTITRRELIQLQREVPLLERSFFADPKGRFRPSRLGTKQKDASLLDLLSGDVTFRSSKPQILVFENVKVAKFPKNLKDVEKALKTGSTLTESQAKRLLNFQTKKTGQFKPVGALTREPEITLAPGEIIKKVKKVGVTLVDGRKVDIVQAKVIRSTAPTRKLLTKARSGKLTSKELETLRAKLKKESGFDPLIGRRKGPSPRARLPKRVPKITKRPPKSPTKAPPRKPGIPKRPPKRPPKSPPKSPTKAPPRKPGIPKRPPKRPPKSPPAKRPPRRPPKRPPRPRPPVAPPRRKAKKRKAVGKRKKQQAYKVLARPVKRRKGQKRPKLIKINKVPLSKSAAKDLRNYIADTSLARTSRIKKAKGKPKNLRLKVPKGYAKRTSKKFRTHRIVKGKRRPLPRGKVIERSRHLLDTRQEKRKIGLRRRIKQITRRPAKRKVTRINTVRRQTRGNPKRINTRPLQRRKSFRSPPRISAPTGRPGITGSKREEMLKNLAKGRRVLASKRRKR